MKDLKIFTNPSIPINQDLFLSHVFKWKIVSVVIGNVSFTTHLEAESVQTIVSASSPLNSIIAARRLFRSTY